MSKSPIKPVYFNLSDPGQVTLRNRADRMTNFSEWVKSKLKEETGTVPLNIGGITALVENLINERIGIKGQPAEIKPSATNESVPALDMDQFF